ncbi:pyridoxal-phosphate-dependent aminotransferase family protein [Halomarina oriensis]|uniref:Aminotransferase class V-fold PLP-dependent enzyme n=1 Tax=Halomarina oriensis TaxID=671145 RepID=A0A6B0GHH7_9EURY|nr:alanine--glyoxylate aminotransferase family protein [Halomarina oriensis]MWG34316.1 aminotransferase class V-fold PLP-dependent enzyme [Halomarina oriensis]
MPDDDFLLLNPGPVPLSEDVRTAMDGQMVSHRSAAFEAIYERAQDGLDEIFTRSTLSGESTGDGTSLVLNGTATMGMEMAVSNLVGPDDEVVALVNGKFGRRFARIADRYATVTRVEVEWGQSFDVEAVEAAITDETALVTVVHNETSTGLLNPVSAVGELTAEYDTLFAVDGVTSVGGDVFRIDDWHVDVAITDGQKALAAPPGISAVFVTERAAEAAHERKEASDGAGIPFYSDMPWHLRKAEQHQTPFTSAVPLFRALAVAVDEIHEEGMSDRIERHRRQAEAFRDGFAALGLEAFPDADGPTELSNTLTAIALPEAIRGDDATAFFDAVAERDVSISGGQAHLGGDIFRVSNMGHLTPEQVARGVRTVGEALGDVGVDCDPEAGVAAVEDVLNG